MSDLPEQSATGFWSIERAVAFVVGPVVTAASGWFSAFVAKKWGIHLNGGELAAIFGTGALSASGLTYKWLHGRQLESKALPFVEGLENNPVVGGFIHTTLHDLEGLAQSAASHAVQAIQGGPAPPDSSIPPATNDPAPAGQVADAGAASEV